MKTPKSVRFSIKRPDKTRRSFAVIRDTTFLDGTREQVHVDDPRIDSLNLNLHRELLTVDRAYAEVKGVIVPALKKEAGVKERERLEACVSDNNKKVYQAFWAEKYQDGNLKNETATRNDLLAALRAIEPLSISTSDRKEIRAKLSGLAAKKQRRHVIRVNQLLEFLERPAGLEKKHREQKEVDYVSWDELQEIIPHIYAEEVQHLAVALFGTGVRIGEAFAPGFSRLKPNKLIWINKQMDLDLQIRDIKNCKPHHCMILPEAIDGYRQWCEVPTARKEELRGAAIQQIIRASKKAFPKKKEKQVSAHDLRHSYAIHWLGLGASLTQVSNVLGDDYATVQLHYTGFAMTDEQVDGMQKLLKAR